MRNDMTRPGRIGDRVDRSSGGKRTAAKAVIMSVAAIVAVGLVGMAGQFVTPAARAPASSPSADPIVGSIVISSPNRNDCKELKLDNATGAVTDNGTSDCTAKPQGRGTRIEAIANGFRSK
jgi:hypothetical protein